MSRERTEEEKIPWIFLIPFMVVAGFFGTVWQVTSLHGCWMNPATFSSTIGVVIICYSALTATPFIAFYFAGALGKLGFFKKKVNLATLTWLYTTTLCLSYYLGMPESGAFCSNYGAFLGNRIMSPPEETYRLVPWFMAPPVEVAKQILEPGPTPWADLMPMIVFWWIFMVIHGLLTMFVATLWRKNWIDVEKVPFPHTLAAYELLVRVVPEKKERRGVERLTSPFMLGLLLGLIVWIPTIFIELFPWFPDIYGWRTNTCGFGSYFIQPGEPLSSIIGMARIEKEPLGVAIAYFAPLHILFNIWFWWLVLVILSQVAYMFGYYTAIPETPGCGRVWCGDISISYGEPFKWTSVLIGGMWSLAIFLLVLNWRYIRDTLRAAFGGMSPGERAEFEKNEPVSYRTTYLMITVFFVAAIAVYAVCDINLLSGLLTIINMLVLWFASMRFIGLAGIYYRKTDKGYALHRLLLWPKAPEVMDRDFVLSCFFNTQFTDAPDKGAGTGGNFLTAFEAYKLASLTGISSRSVFKVLVVSIIIYSLVNIPAFLWIAYTLGITRLPGSWGMYGCNALLERSANPQTWNSCPGTEPWIPHFTAGFIFVALLSWLHARFVWFPFEPVGFILGIGAGFEWGFWDLALAAWILKLLTLRIGGSKLYEEYGAPFAGGYIAGHMLALIPGTILTTIRFFVPF